MLDGVTDAKAKKLEQILESPNSVSKETTAI